MTELPVKVQEMLLETTCQYVDAQADTRIKAGANDCLARIFSTVLGRHIFEDAIAQFSQIKTSDEGGTAEEAQKQLEKWIFKHPLDAVVATFFDPQLEVAFAAVFDSEVPELAVERYNQWQHQLTSTNTEIITYFQTDGWRNILAEIATLDRRWFQFNHSVDGLATAEAKSDRLRRAILQALEEIRQLHRLFETPAGRDIGMKAAQRYQKKMQERGVPFPHNDRTKPQGFGRDKL